MISFVELNLAAGVVFTLYGGYKVSTTRDPVVQVLAWRVVASGVVCLWNAFLISYLEKELEQKEAAFKNFRNLKIPHR